MRNAIGYIRVSTEEQAGDSKFGINSQKKAISRYAEDNGFIILRWCVDVISGVKDGRPELDKILYPVEDDDYSAVIVFKNDRVARDTKLYFYYLYVLEKRNIKLLSTEEHFSEGDDFANIYRSLLMFVAEQERRNIALRTSRGRALKAKCGGYSGGRVPYGYKPVDGVLTIVPEEAEMVRIIFTKRKHGLVMAQIAEDLDVLGYKNRQGRRIQISTVQSILNHEKFYRGFYKYGGSDWTRGVHEPILA